MLPRAPHRLRPLATTLMVTLAAITAHAAELSPSSYSLLPPNVTGSTRTLPGESRESRLSAERSLVLSPRLQWETSTDLQRTRIEQPFPLRAQSLSLSTGPRIKLGNSELALPFITGREASSVGAESTWSGGAPRMTVALGPNDRIKLEARISHRNDTQSTSRRQTTAVSWRHKFNDRWSLTTGMRQVQTSDAMDAITSSTAETFASVEASLRGDWRWSLGSSLSGNSYGAVSGTDGGRRDRSAAFTLSTRYPLYGGWWISGELRTKQTWGDSEPPLANQSGGLRLFRNY